MRMTAFLAAALLALGLFAWSPAAHAINVGDKAKPFRLQGHDGKWYTLDSFKKRLLIFFYEGTQSRKENAWFKDRFTEWHRTGRIKKENVAKIGMANYMESAIPNVMFDLFIKREMERNYPGELVLRDRDGTMQRLWSMRNGRSNIYLFDQRRRLIWKSSGPLSRRSAEQLLRLLRRLAR